LFKAIPQARESRYNPAVHFVAFRESGRLAFLALGIWSCRGAPTTQVHLFPKDARVALRTKGGETRPSVVLRPNQGLVVPVVLQRGSRLSFAWGQEPGPDRGFLSVTVRVNGALVYEGKPQRVGNTQAWRRVSLVLDRQGPATLEFRGEHSRGTGEPIPSPLADDSPWVTLASPRLCPPSSRKARVLVWISQDSVRADHLGAYGYRRPTSPAFDRLAASSVLFENAVSPASWTLPSLTSQFTSRYPSFHGAVSEQNSRRLSEPTLFEIVWKEGFTVLGFTGNEFISSAFHLASGFDALSYVEQERGAGALTDVALRGLDDWGGGDLVLFVHYMDPHYPYTPPKPFDRMFDPHYLGRADGWNFQGLANLRPNELGHVEALYDGEVAYEDQQIGVLLEGLKRRGLLDNAIVVYTADHGEEFQDHGGWTHSRTVYEEMLHIPLAIGIPGGHPLRVAEVVSGIDIAPTILDVLGIPSPPSFQGRSLAPLLRGGTLKENPVFGETQRNLDRNLRVSVRVDHSKYVLVTPAAPEFPPKVLKEELYDLLRDPRERRPQAGAALEPFRQRVQAFLTKARRNAPPAGRAALDPELKERLHALGYVD
jgi:arylsulfatase A-like enzyme